MPSDAANGSRAVVYLAARRAAFLSRWIFAAGAIALANTSRARGDTYAASVLYQIQPPAGFDSAAPAFGQQDAALGQMIGNGFGAATGNNHHALLWNTSTSTPIDLNPANIGGISNSYARGTSGTQQVGFGEGVGTNHYTHALVWNGAANTAIDLNPAQLGITSSQASATSGAQQVGLGYGSGTNQDAHALLWNGSAVSAVDLHPTNLSGFESSFANGTNGSQQVGVGYGAGTNVFEHALLWNGSAGSAIDLHPSNLSGLTSSIAYGTSGNQQVGYANGTAFDFHAILWRGAANTAVDLNPTNLGLINTSFAYNTDGTRQVGYGSGPATDDSDHAIVWKGSASAATDLQTFMPVAGDWLHSRASTIDDFGNIYGAAYGTYNDVTGYFAVKWSPVNINSFANAAGGNWSSSANWSQRKIPNAIDALASFQQLGSGPIWVTATAARTVGQINFNSTNSYTLSGASAITMDVGSGSATISSSNGDHIISSPIVLNDDLAIYVASAHNVLTLGNQITTNGHDITIGGAGTVRVQNIRTTKGLNLTGRGTLEISAGTTAISAAGVSKITGLTFDGGRLNLTNNALVFDYTSIMDSRIHTVRDVLSDGRIFSSQADGSHRIGYADNATLGSAQISSLSQMNVDATSIVMMYTLCGDANLDGVVDVADFTFFFNGFGKGGDAIWQNGDFDYNGVVDVADFTVFFTAFGQSALPPTAAMIPFMALAHVPEPVSATALAIGFVLLRRNLRP